MLGYAFMGKAHSNAFQQIPYITWPPPLEPRLVGIAGRNEEAVGEAARALRLRVRDDRLAQARRRRVDRAVRQRRAELAARRADDRRGRGRQARRLREAARPRRRRELRDLAAGRRDGRQAPVRVQLPLRPGRPARARDDRGRRARRGAALPRPLPPGLGRRPVARHLALRRRRRRLRRARRPDDARRRPRTVPERRDLDRLRASRTRSCPGRKVDDAVEAAVEFENGSIGTLEATRFAHGRRNAFQWEINGTKGSLAFDMERLNELQVFRADGDRARGFKTVLVSGGDHPFWQHWWPPGHIIGWGDTFVHELHHLLKRSPTTATSRRTARTSRTATARPRSATRSSARA